MPLLAPIDTPAAQVDEVRPASWPAAFAVGAAPPPPDKAFYGTPEGETWETENFGIVWSAGGADLATAQVAGEALEAGWEALVDQAGWQPPVSGESWLIWVVLDPFLGQDGATVELASVDFPTGYPVIALDPALAVDDARFRAVAVHQFAYAVQFRQRDTWADTDAEAWFWEASAVHAERVALPGNDTWTTSVGGLLDAPERRFDSRQDGHDQGMALFAAWLDQESVGTRTVWEVSRGMPGATWDAIVADATGQPALDVWAAFGAALAAGRIDGQELVGLPVASDDVFTGTSSSVSYLGLDAYTWNGTAPTGVTVAPLLPYGDTFLLGGPEGIGETIGVEPGDAFAVVGAGGSNALYQLQLGSYPGEEGTNPEPEQPGFGGTLGPTDWTIDHRCGCAHGTPSGAWFLLVLLGVRRRR